jgi:hypothetical protein
LLVFIPQLAEGLLVRFGRYISIPDIEAQLAPNNYMYSAAHRRRQRRDRSRTHVFGRIEIELHQRHMRPARVPLQDRACTLTWHRIEKK